MSENKKTARSSDGAKALTVNPTAGLAAVYLRTPVRQPNVYRKRIAKVDGDPRAGDWVVVYAPALAPAPNRSQDSVNAPESRDGAVSSPPRILGYGIYNPRSEIALRIIRFGPELPDQSFWDRLFERAIALRHDLLRIDVDSNAYRIVHGEADGVPGLVIDRFDNVLSLEAYSIGMYQRGPEIARRLIERLGIPHWHLRTSPQFLSQEGVDRPRIGSADAPGRSTITEFGTRFRVQFDEDGHKTGFFCDQRDNRRRLASYCENKSVLDLCCYSGGFAIQAKRLGKAAEATGVDLDEAPLETARENANLNQVRVKFVQADVFPYMRDMIRGRKQFDVVVLDPPKLIRSRAEIEEGTQKHFDLNRLAIQLVQPGGLFLTCSCAGLLSAYEFTNLVARAARHAETVDRGSAPSFVSGREIQIIAKTGAAKDHPVGGNCLETEYLTAIWARIDDRD